MKVPTSQKRATIFFSMPEKGQSCTTEHLDKPSPELRRVIEKTHAYFWKKYMAMKDEQKDA